MWPNFSHIYIEEGAEKYPLTDVILSKFSNTFCVTVHHYKDIFNRPQQNFQSQKRSMKLILAVKKDNLVYDGSEFSQSMGHDNFYYNSMILNCVYNCDYCYLQGMYGSANIVIFVNIGDFFSAVVEKLQKPMYLAISYDTDLLAFENVIPLCAQWIEFTRAQPNLTIEIRTKSANFKSIKSLEPCDRTILAWTMSPDEVVEKYEKGTPPLRRRLEAAKEAIDEGWKVRVCFDPVIRIDHWKEYYSQCVQTVFEKLEAVKLYDVSTGVFRMNADYLRKIRKQRQDSDVLYYPYVFDKNAASYPETIKNEMNLFIQNLLLQYLPSTKVFI